MDIKLKRWDPWIARLANVTPITVGFMVDIN